MSEEKGVTIKQLEGVLEKFNNKNQKDLKKTEDRFAVMLEDVRGDIKAVAEGVSVVRKDLNEFKEETRENFETLFNFKDEMTSFKQETENNFQAVFDWQSNFSDSFDNELEEARKELNEIKDELKKRPTGKAFDALESKVADLEIRVDKMCKERVC